MTPTIIGYLEPFRLDPKAVAVYAPVAILTVLAGAAWPAMRAGRVPIVEALQYE